ncbi:MAG: Gfo/Idh/MocA family oxidoreductase [Treponema sp.]|nr:Gfo/Idh/MocA family oxidoreductase [Treponema sp.]
MPKTYRIGAIGFAHVHMKSTMDLFAALGDRVQMVAAADVEPIVPSVSKERGTRIEQYQWALDKYKVKPYDSYIKLLDENQIDIALVSCENSLHPVVMEEILRRGIHVVVEKPLSVTMEGALRIERASRVKGARVITNWPSAWYPGVRTAKRLMDQGTIGKLFKFSYRNADSLGPFSYGQAMSDSEKGQEWWYRSDAGGGAMMDYCCYGACMASWFVGTPPQAAYGIKANFNSPYGSADDFSAITVRFASALAMLEGSWTTVNSGVPNGPLLYGKEGTMVVRLNGDVEVYTKRGGDTPDQLIKADPLPAGRDDLAKETLHHLDTGEPLFPMLDLPLNMAAMSILDAGLRSAQSGKMEMANDGIWCVGDDSIFH